VIGWWHAQAVHVDFLIYLCQTDLHVTIRKGVQLSLNTHLIYSQTPHLSTCTLLVFSYFCEQGKSYQGEILGMNNTMSYSKVLLSYHYSSAYELGYSFHVIILTYELAYSLYVMI
jgi:hypothetical protein